MRFLVLLTLLANAALAYSSGSRIPAGNAGEALALLAPAAIP